VYYAVSGSGCNAGAGQAVVPQAFHASERNDYLSQAWYFGMAAAMIAFNLLLFIALRNVNYLLYVSFVACMALAIAAQNGLTRVPVARCHAVVEHFTLCRLFLLIASLLQFMRYAAAWEVIPS
jgi:hypothetical protein